MDDNTNNNIKLFSNSENKQILMRCKEIVRSAAFASTNGVDYRKPLDTILGAMITGPKDFDNYCQVTIKALGARFIHTASEISESLIDLNKVNLVTSLAYRFLCELEISQPSDLSFELSAVKTFFEENYQSLTPEMQREFVYTNYSMPIYIVKSIINHTNISAIQKFNEHRVREDELKEEWQKDLDKRKSDVDNLAGAIKELDTKYNFVGLAHGFNTIAQEKSAEKLHSFVTLIALSFLMLTPILFELRFVIINAKDIEQYKSVILYSAPAVFATELVLLYFFKIVLGNYKSANSQLLQIKLRLSLCQFIQSYTTYAQKIKKDDAGALEKFESIIFSSIVATEENIPTTFDGIEQIAKLVKSVRS